MKRILVTLGLGFVAALAGGWLAVPKVLYRSHEQPVQFSHKVHVSDAVGMKCDDCHRLGDGGAFSGVPRNETCAGCHAEAQGKSADEKRMIDRYLAKGEEIPWRVYARQPANVYFPHDVHVNLAKLSCERCHGPHGKSDRLRAQEVNRLSTYSRDVEGYSLAKLSTRPWEEGMKMDDCSRCHHERGVAEGCLTCHK